MQHTWDELEHRVREAQYSPGTAGAVAGIRQALDDFHREAEWNARNGLARIWGHDAQLRYQNEPEFHAMVDILVRTIVASIFNELPLTDEERNKRSEMVDFSIANFNDPLRDNG